VHELPRGGSFAVPRERFLGDGTRSLRGGRRPGNLERRAAGRECPCTSPVANGKENWESSLPQRATVSALRVRFDDHALRHDSRLSPPASTDRQCARSAHSVWASSVAKLARHEPSWPGTAGESLSRMRRRSSLSLVAPQDRTTKTERATSRPVPRRPLRAVKMP
jgi:hypothetical protein